MRSPLRDPYVQYLPLPNQVVEGPQGLLKRRVFVVAVALVEVDVVDPEALERVVALLGDVLAREPTVVWSVPHREVHLRGKEIGVPLEALERMAHDLLCVSPHVDIGSIKEVDTELVGFLNAGLCPLLGYAPAVG
jgi:hypothetical protein